jgi:polyvinyl alcohol dehydrogenase (cytochrome)
MHCVECHGHSPRLGAPVPLIDAASFEIARSGSTVAALAELRVQNKERPMPPAMLLDATTVMPLVSWLHAGAPKDPAGCKVKDPFDMPAAGSGALAMAGSAAPTVAANGVAEPGDYPMFGGDLSNNHDNPSETKLSPSTVGMLKELWTYKGAATTSTPAVYGGVVYLPSWDGKVTALDSHNGSKIWSTSLPHLIDSSPAVTAKQVFVSDDHGSVFALERDKGTMQWTTQVDKHPEAHLWSSPIYVEADNLVIVGVASGEEQVQPPYSFRGSVVGLDGTTGLERWRFYTTPGDATSGPGHAIWATATVDTTRKLLFIGTGNAYSGKAGQYADSLLAVRYDNGMLAWSKQFTQGDVFSIYGGEMGPDYDIGASANLFKLGAMDVVGIAIKSGDYAVLQRETGMPVWMTHVGGMGSMGGMIASAAFAGDKVFVASNTWPAPQQTIVAALDAAQGKQLWMQMLPDGLVYGAPVHANGVVFVGSSNATINAYDAQSGKVLWTAKTPDSVAAGPSVSHGIVLVPWGYTWTLRQGMAGMGGLTAYGLP